MLPCDQGSQVLYCKLADKVRDRVECSAIRDVQLTSLIGIALT